MVLNWAVFVVVLDVALSRLWRGLGVIMIT
jgi:hypothetical protein